MSETPRYQVDGLVSTTVKITKDNLPSGPHWDEDGACFTAELDDPKLTGCEWRWKPNNWKAFEKGTPDKKLFPFVMPAALSNEKEKG